MDCMGVRCEGPPRLVERLERSLEASGIAITPASVDSDCLRVLIADPPGANGTPLEAVQGPCVVVCEQSVSPEHASAWLALGASDVIDGMSVEEAAAVVAARAKRMHEIASLMASRLVQDTVLGISRVWTSCLRRIVEIARFSDANVLITGESGTGKELAAKLIHALDGRPKRGPFVVLDCGTVTPELAGSELFGHVRGAYTGAIAEREGAVALADGGTLFLDEFGELPMSIQAQMLRALEDGAYKPVGAIQWKRANFRLVCATNRNLHDDVGEGRFRLDLYHRAIGWHVHLPSLRERTEDIPLLARHFAAMAAGRSEPVKLCPSVERELMQRAYPGNLRELRQLMVRVMTRHVGKGPITPGDVPPEDRSRTHQAGWPDEQFEHVVRRGLAQGHGMKAIGRDAEALALRVALEDADGNSRRAAEVLGVSERAVQMRKAATY